MTRAPLSVWRFALAFAGAIVLAGCSQPTGGVAPEDGDAGGLAQPTPDASSNAGRDAATADVTPPPEAAPPDANGDAGATPDAAVTIDAADAQPQPDASPADSDGDGAPDPTDCAPTDPTRWQSLSYSYRDADGDTYTVLQAGALCSGAALPRGYSNVPDGDDCDDMNPAIFNLETLYVDSDGDGAGAGALQSLCLGAITPAGYSTTGTDCAPADPSAWQILSYSYRDADGDGYTVAQSGQMCAGAALPAGYASAGNGNDCDDTNPKTFAAVTFYADADGDGVGAGPAIQACTGGTAPLGDSFSGTDCAPIDASRWQSLAYAFVDRDGDGFTVAESGAVCVGATLAPPYYATAHGNDCNDTNPALTEWGILYADNDGDGAGAGAYKILCDGATIPAGFSRYGDDEDDTISSVGPLPVEDILNLVLD